MNITKRFPGSFSLLCRHRSGPYRFALQRLGQVVTCPVCGRSEKAADLMNDYIYRERQSKRMGRLGIDPQPAEEQHTSA